MKITLQYSFQELIYQERRFQRYQETVNGSLLIFIKLDNQLLLKKRSKRIHKMMKIICSNMIRFLCYNIRISTNLNSQKEIGLKTKSLDILYKTNLDQNLNKMKNKKNLMTFLVCNKFYGRINNLKKMKKKYKLLKRKEKNLKQKIINK